MVTSMPYARNEEPASMGRDGSTSTSSSRRSNVAGQTMPNGTVTISARWAATARMRRVLPEPFGIVRRAA
jgi:hypothetical protein